MSPHACNRFAAALPPEGAQPALGRPGARLMSPHACNRFAAALPPEGAQPALGPAGARPGLDTHNLQGHASA
jgi:hypothetical protein